jgi:hypothetical protein
MHITISNEGVEALDRIIDLAHDMSDIIRESDDPDAKADAEKNTAAWGALYDNIEYVQEATCLSTPTAHG